MFTYTACQPRISNTRLLANPITQNVTGQRYFFTDQSGVIRVNLSTTATSTDNPTQLNYA